MHKELRDRNIGAQHRRGIPSRSQASATVTATAAAAHNTSQSDVHNLSEAPFRPVVTIGKARGAIQDASGKNSGLSEPRQCESRYSIARAPRRDSRKMAEYRSAFTAAASSAAKIIKIENFWPQATKDLRTDSPPAPESPLRW